MVVKITSGKSIRGILCYNENKVAQGQATLMLASGFAGDVDGLSLPQKLKRFEHLTMLNAAVKTNALQITLNFHASDHLDNQKLQQIASEYMERIGFGEQPFLAYRHRDASHPHLHIATTNIRSDGSRIDIHGIGYRLSENARKEIEQKYGLVKAEGRKLEQRLSIRPAVYGEKPTKQTISAIVTAVAREYKFTTFAEFNAALQQFNVRAERGAENSEMFRHRGLLYTIINEIGKPMGVPIKASQIYCKPTLDNLEKQFERNLEKRLPLREPLRTAIQGTLNRYQNITRKTFSSELKKLQVGILYRRNEQGLVYGVTFIDHKNKTVFNGSDLGKVYSAKQLTERFGTSDKLKTYLKPAAIKQPHFPIAEQSKPYLEPIAPTNYLEGLFSKASNDQGQGMPKRRKKKRRGSHFKL